ncbi:hypothetical protein BCV69DRAFT_279617 [Microstroma glucosiphilum]|uniref:DNA-directed RNA polymerase III subunit n=1 Tax=Pseudomicrostroma glucosiphilum TaxID=1684307 RepID=A0A316UFI1_9BASI|nr:hypothetical protein BCV69DRAFT_279617 [Pseudomicrostroma glucosiphilum]PWN23688.1 hypothetical protein BCV69DRAFT_279617 [Pseudomicrostroma glucosiphilum]
MASRGGGGGRGGRGGGRGGGPSKPTVPMGEISFAQVNDIGSKTENLYPYQPNIPRPQPPSEQESRAATLQLEYLDAMRRSAYWPMVAAGERKIKELPRYTDRYRPEEQDPPSLKRLRLQKEVFPRDVWRVYMEGETRREQVRARAKARKSTLANFNWDAFEAANDGTASGGPAGGGGGGAGGGGEDDGLGQEDDLEPKDDYEDQEEDDYAQNYFDNGEDDGGEEDAGGGEAYE